MKKSLLIAAAALLAAGTVQAETGFYPASTEIMGELTGVSANGQYATIADEEMGLSYLWDRNNPTEYKEIVADGYSKIQVYGVSDDCTLVAAIYIGDGKWRPAFCKGLDGEWTFLEVDPYTLNTAEAVAISSDAKYIAGYMMLQGGMEDGPVQGAYYPAQWTLNENGEYEAKYFYNFDTYGQQGFLINSQSNDGRILAGYLHAGCSDGFLPALIVDGEFKMFDDVVIRMEPWYYKGEIMGEDEVSYIDGFKDTDPNNTFMGGFNSIDKFGNVYGRRTLAYDVDEEGNGTLVTRAAVYNVDSNEWFYDDIAGAFSCGYDRQVMFCAGASMIMDGQLIGIKEGLNIGKDFNRTMTAITHMSDDTTVLGGMYQILHPATGEYQYYPFMVTLDEPIVDLAGIEIVVDKTPVAILLSAGKIQFCGAEGVVYDLNGRLMGQGETVNVEAGTYVARVGNSSRTVIVK